MPKLKTRQKAQWELAVEGKLPDVIQHLERLLNEYGPDAEIDWVYDYDGRDVMLFYYREETDEEMARREVDTLERAKKLEAQERKQYLALKAKFEKGPQDALQSAG